MPAPTSSPCKPARARRWTCTARTGSRTTAAVNALFSWCLRPAGEGSYRCKAVFWRGLVRYIDHAFVALAVARPSSDQAILGLQFIDKSKPVVAHHITLASFPHAHRSARGQGLAGRIDQPD